MVCHSLVQKGRHFLDTGNALFNRVAIIVIVGMRAVGNKRGIM